MVANIQQKIVTTLVSKSSENKDVSYVSVKKIGLLSCAGLQITASWHVVSHCFIIGSHLAKAKRAIEAVKLVLLSNQAVRLFGSM